MIHFRSDDVELGPARCSRAHRSNRRQVPTRRLRRTASGTIEVSEEGGAQVEKQYARRSAKMASKVSATRRQTGATGATTGAIDDDQEQPAAKHNTNKKAQAATNREQTASLRVSTGILAAN